MTSKKGGGFHRSVRNCSCLIVKSVDKQYTHKPNQIVPYLCTVKLTSFLMLLLSFFNRVGGVMISVLASSPDRVKPKTMKLVFVASPLSTQH